MLGALSEFFSLSIFVDLFCRPNVQNPKSFVGIRVVKQLTTGNMLQGEVVKMHEEEGINTMFNVKYENGEIVSFRLIYDYVKGDLWTEQYI